MPLYPSRRWSRLLLAIGVLIAGCGVDAVDETVSISEVREELLAYVIDIPGADGYRYRITDDRGRPMDALKVVPIAETGVFAAVYHWWSDSSLRFTSSLATSADLLHWEWRVDLVEHASMPTIAPATDGGYVVAWEDDRGPRVALAYYPTWDALLAGDSAKRFVAERQLSECAEGTPNIYAASSAEVEIGLHFGCATAGQARGITDWTSWTVEEEPLLDRAARFQGYRGIVGDRDHLEFEGFGFTFLEAQATQDDWRTFRILLYDDDLGAADRAGFPAAPAVPPSVHVFLFTHAGSAAFTNFSITEVVLDGRRALVMGVFIPEEGAGGEEAGQLLYYRFLE